jgi:hypothetical protein
MEIELSRRVLFFVAQRAKHECDVPFNAERGRATYETSRLVLSITNGLFTLRVTAKKSSRQ